MPELNSTTLSHADAVAHSVGVVTTMLHTGRAQAHEVPALIRSTFDAIVGLGQPANVGAAAPAIEPATPAQIRKSITPDALFSFIDGKPYKAMRRHLTAHGHTPESYRAAYGLPADYPLVAANYSAKRSAISKAIALGVPGGRSKPALAA